ncbi:MAG: FAD-dependent oxidoreductase, partial [Acidimicrobiia bacterium]
MARIVFVGGGIVGLCGALLLARDGHDVTVLERDPAPPTPPEIAWTHWERRGVNQFRLPHILHPRFRALMEVNAPEVVRALEDVGAHRLNVLRDAHPLLTGGFRETDARYDAFTARRPVSEAAIARVVDRTENVNVRRGVAVTGLIAGEPATKDIPHAIGVRTESGEDVLADLVIDAGGRRSLLTSRLDAIGARLPIAHKDASGFMYFCRHFHSGDGSIPPMMANPTMEHETHTLLTLPADNGTWGMAVVTSANDVV